MYFLIASLNRIFAMVRRHLLLQFRDLQRIFEAILWPLIDVTLFGFIGSWAQQITPTFISLAFIPVVGTFFWPAVLRGSSEISINLLDELWSKNLLSLLGSPLLVFEWIIATLLLSVVRVLLVFIVTAPAIKALFGLNIFMFGWWLVPIVFSLICSGWSLGFFSLALIIRFGQRIQTFAGVIGWIFAPMCGVFYTMDVLPSWMQMIGFLLPMSYIFKSIHAYMLHGIMPISTLLSSFWINAVYLFASLFFLKCMFARALQRGLARLEND